MKISQEIIGKLIQAMSVKFQWKIILWLLISTLTTGATLQEFWFQWKLVLFKNSNLVPQ